jgi:hypothetical protein
VVVRFPQGWRLLFYMIDALLHDKHATSITKSTFQTTSSCTP